MNKQYMAKLSDEEYLEKFKVQSLKFKDEENNFSVPTETLTKALPVIRDRAHTFGEISDMFKREGELGFVTEIPTYDVKKLSWKGDAADTTSLYLKKIIELLTPLKDFSAEDVKKAVWPYAEEIGKGNVLWPMRYALTGRDKSPDPFISASILGKEETLSRLDRANKALNSIQGS